MRKLFFIFTLFVTKIFISNSVAQNILGKDTLICSSDNLELESTLTGTSYEWSTDETTSKIKVHESGDYIITVQTANGIRKDTVTVKFLQPKIRKANNWILGNNAGISFSNNAPITASSNTNFPNHNFVNGTSTVSDNDGNLMLYADGNTIYSKNGNVIQAIANSKATLQNIAIMNCIGSARYFQAIVATTQNIIIYTIDINANSGNGAIINTQDLPPSSGNFALVKNPNNTAYNMAYISADNKNILVYEIGKKASAVLKKTTAIDNIGNSVSPILKFNPFGTKLSIASEEASLYNFNAYTGEISLEIKLKLDCNLYTSTEFASDGSKLYFTGNTASESKLYQIDLYDKAGDNNTYRSNSISSPLSKPFGALQFAPNNKIYIARQGLNYISAIDNPSSWPLANNFVEKSIDLQSGVSGRGLPNFPADYFLPPSNPSIFASDVCFPDFVKFQIGTDLHLYPFAKLNISINTGETGTALINAGKNIETTFKYKEYGKYKIQAKLTTACNVINVSYNELKVVPQPKLDIKNIAICDKKLDLDTIKLDAGNNKYTGFVPTYAWKSENIFYDSIQTMQPKELGSYMATVRINQCVTTDNFSIVQHKTALPELGSNKEGCLGDSILLLPQLSNNYGAFVWQSKQTSKEIYAKADGWYAVTYSDDTCTNRDSVQCTFYIPPANPNFASKDTICQDSTLVLDAQNSNGYNFTWNTNAKSQKIDVKKQDIYWVDIYNNGCKKRYTTDIFKRTNEAFNFLDKEPICHLESNKIDLNAGKGMKYTWLPNGETTEIISADTGQYTVTKIDQYNCKATKTVVIYELCNARIYIPNAFSPNEDGDNPIFKPIGININNYELKIFNRWGEIIFYSQNIINGWDGKYLGENVPVGVYPYIIKYSKEATSDKELVVKKGIVNLFR
jgi:gliding motility-associated-like protein